MIGLHVTVPLACWRKGAARELFETDLLPPPATCYGALLSLVGETERDRYRGCRVSAGLLNDPGQSTVLRTLWRIKDDKIPQGNKTNAKPDFQQLVVDAALMIWCDSGDEAAPAAGLEARVRAALRESCVHRSVRRLVARGIDPPRQRSPGCAKAARRPRRAAPSWRTPTET